MQSRIRLWWLNFLHFRLLHKNDVDELGIFVNYMNKTIQRRKQDYRVWWGRYEDNKKWRNVLILVNHGGKLRIWSLINNVHKSRYKGCVVQKPDVGVCSRLYSLSHKNELLPSCQECVLPTLRHSGEFASYLHILFWSRGDMYKVGLVTWY